MTRRLWKLKFAWCCVVACAELGTKRLTGNVVTQEGILEPLQVVGLGVAWSLLTEKPDRLHR